MLIKLYNKCKYCLHVADTWNVARILDAYDLYGFSLNHTEMM